jgi:chromosome segregation ATPase
MTRPLSALLPLLLTLAASGTEASPPEPRANGASAGVRTYTNDDLERVAPFRGQTGALSVPSSSPDESREDSPARTLATDAADRARDEAYWRKEAARVREKSRSLEDQAAELRSRLESLARARRAASSGSGKGAKVDITATLERRLGLLEARRRRLEEDLQDRARRANALPGWLR